jgi:hypothetical protein
MLSTALFSHPLSYAVSVLTAAGSEAGSARVFAVPQGQTTLAKKVFIVKAQLFQAGAGHIGQL